MIVALIATKYTQSNSVALVRDGQLIGSGAGQQSRVHCVRLADEKARLWHLRQHAMVLALPLRDGLSRPEKSFPFRDNIDVASTAGVRYLAQPGGSARDAEVVEACDEYGMAMAMTDLRLFHH